MKKLPSIFFILILNLSSGAWGGSQGRGGDNPVKIDEGTIRELILGTSLKSAMISYLQTLNVENISEFGVKATFERMLKDNALERDIKTPGNYFIGGKCVDAYNSSVPASTGLGTGDGPNIGGKICFDLKRLVSFYQELYPNGLSEEQLMIKLASVAFHNHAHHFQIYDPRRIEENEQEAYEVSGYVQITARLGQTPTLVWARRGPGVCSRTKAVVQILEEKLGKRCADITPADLASIDGLEIYGFKSLTTFSADTFEGMTGIHTIDIQENANLTSLPSRLFRNLPSLKVILIANNEGLSGVPGDLFEGLPQIKQIDLFVHKPVIFPHGLFDKIPTLENLVFESTKALSIPAHAFSKLPNLQTIYLQLRLNDIPENLLAENKGLKKIFFKQYGVGEIPENFLSNQFQLEDLEIIGSELKTLPVKLVQASSHLKEISVRGNAIAVLAEGIFSELHELEVFSLDSQVESISQNFFKGDSFLRVIYINSSPNLTTVPAGLFNGLTHVETVGLQNNGITHLPEGLFKNLPTLKRVNLSANRLSDQEKRLLKAQLGEKVWF